jgi:excinuclease ABC subunit A
MEIKIIGAKENNLKNINISIPLRKMVVITGVSGSGKSSLAFDTIYKEGQRRYLETFSSYARGFIGNFERPKVDHISGLSPVISIEQKTISKNPRSTVGTITEIYDYLRLLYAKTAKPVSFVTKEVMEKQDIDTINNLIKNKYTQADITILAPIIKARKGHYNELFQILIKKGFLKVKVDGEIIKLKSSLKLDRYKIHDIDLVIDKFKIDKQSLLRLENSVKLAIEESKGSVIIQNNASLDFTFYSEHLTCPNSGISYKKPEPNSFSFNSPKGYCQQCKGIGILEEINIDNIILNKTISIANGGIEPIGSYQKNWIFSQIEIIGKKYKFNINDSIESIPKKGIEAILYGLNDRFSYVNKNIGVTERIHLDFEGVINFISNEYANNKSKKIQRWAKKYFTKKQCNYCLGQKLNRESLHFLISKKNISEISQYDIYTLKKWCIDISLKTKGKQQIISNEILKEILKRLNFLINVGLGYLTISRRTDSLSGGESQRIKIASQIGSELTNVLYILDEPSIGLHSKDSLLLIKSLKDLQKLGNSIIVVEHDKSIMEASDYIIDVGPSAGINGGEITFKGTYKELIKSKSITSRYISKNNKININNRVRQGSGKKILIKGANGNNLKNIDISIPLGTLTLVTGVSGSGKSTLINGTLYPIISNKIYKSIHSPYQYKSIEGIEHIDKIININQSPIGRTSRSNPATYVGLFTDVRNLYAELKESKIKGYTASRFSFNVSEGCCKECKGHGYILVQLNLLPDLEVPCQICSGKRFNTDTLEIEYQNKNIFDVLEMSIDNAVIFFDKIPKIKYKLQALISVGMGYLQLGQSSTKLSGGEAQRVKLASELSKKETGNTLYILDEPTTGLHFFDIEILMKAINLLVDKGNSVIIIEHNLDVIKQADYVIDLGPDGGEKGGTILFQGEPKELANNKISYTGMFLKKEISSQDA